MDVILEHKPMEVELGLRERSYVYGGGVRLMGAELGLWKWS